MQLGVVAVAVAGAVVLAVGAAVVAVARRLGDGARCLAVRAAALALAAAVAAQLAVPRRQLRRQHRLPLAQQRPAVAFAALAGRRGERGRLLDAQDRQRAFCVLDCGDGQVRHVDVVHLQRAQVQADGNELVALAIDGAGGAGVEGPRRQAERCVQFRMCHSLGCRDSGGNLDNGGNWRFGGEGHERWVKLDAIQLQR